MRLIASSICCVLALSGCALSGGSGSTSQPVERVEPVTSVMEGNPHLRALYQLLVAETAAQRDRLDVAAEAYAQAAEISDQAAIAERATRFALYAEAPELVRRAAQRWLVLEPDAIDPHQALGMAALMANDRDEAVRQFLESLPAAESARESALARLSRVLTGNAEDDVGLAVAQRIAAELPDERMAQYLEARVAAEAGYPAISLDAADRALALSPGWRPAAMLRVNALLESGRSGEAVDALAALIEREGDEVDIELRLEYARTLAAAGRPEQAIAEFEAMIERYPTAVRILYPAALVAYDASRLEQARTWFRQLIEEGQYADVARYYLGRIAERTGDLERALTRYGNTGGVYREEARLRIASVLAAQGRVDEALQRLAQLRADQPDLAVAAWATEGDILRGAGRLDASIESFTQALAEHPGRSELLYGRALTYVEQNRLAEAEADLRRLLEAEPDNTHAMNALGYTLADSNQRLDEAERLIRAAYERRPNDPAILDSMGWVAYRQGRLEEALEYLRRAHAIEVEGEIAAHLGEVLWKLGRRDEARAVWADALERFPESEILIETRERLAP